MAKRKDGLLYYGIQMPAPSAEDAKEFEDYWLKITVGQGAPDAFIEKTSTHWKMEAGFETAREVKEFSDFFHKMTSTAVEWRFEKGKWPKGKMIVTH
jgi:hypothetical protein